MHKVFLGLVGSVVVCMGQIEIPEGTKVRVRLEQQLSSATAEENQPVQLSVAEELKVNQTTVLTPGAVVNGTVVLAVPKRRMGRTGKLDFSIDHIIAPDGGRIPVRYSLVKKEGGSHAVKSGVITAGVAVVFWPAAPFVLLMKGKDTVFQRGMIFDVFTDSKYVVKHRQDLAGAGPADAGPAAAPTVRVSISSEPSGADIEVNGNFAGSTPSTVPLATGPQTIRVSKNGKIWQRTLNLQPGSDLTVNAVLADERKN